MCSYAKKFFPFSLAMAVEKIGEKPDENCQTAGLDVDLICITALISDKAFIQETVTLIESYIFQPNKSHSASDIEE